MRETVTARSALKIGARANDARRAAGGDRPRGFRHSVATRQAHARKSGAYLPGMRRRCGRRPSERVGHSVATWHVVYANPALTRRTRAGAATGDRPRWFRYSMATRHAHARKSGAYPPGTRRRCGGAMSGQKIYCMTRPIMTAAGCDAPARPSISGGSDVS